MNPTIARLGRRLRLGVVGGGPGSFIGAVHRTAARLDDHYEVVAGVLSGNPERSRAAARAIGIAEERAYAYDVFGDSVEYYSNTIGFMRDMLSTRTSNGAFPEQAWPQAVSVAVPSERR